MLDIILCAIGIFLILGSFLSNTEDVQSALVFKVIPFFSGVYCIAYASIASGVIKIG